MDEVFSTSPINADKLKSGISSLSSLPAVGDYIFAAGSNSGVSHGFMVMAYGPAIGCSSKYLDTSPTGALGSTLQEWLLEQSSMTTPDSPLQFLPLEARDNPATYLDKLQGYNVPYVVDVAGVQRGTPRPFYCSAVKDTAWEKLHPEKKEYGYLFDHESWRFYSVPRSGSVPCDKQFKQAPFRPEETPVQ